MDKFYCNFCKRISEQAERQIASHARQKILGSTVMKTVS